VLRCWYFCLVYFAQAILGGGFDVDGAAGLDGTTAAKQRGIAGHCH